MLPRSEVNLVIKKQEDMTLFLEYLIVQMETIDGVRGSALPYLAAIRDQASESEDSIDFNFGNNPFALGNDLN